MINKITETLNSISSKWACMLSDGTIIDTTLKDKSFSKRKILRILKTVINKTNIGDFIIFSDLIAYRLTFDFIIFVIGTIPRNVIQEKFTKLTSMYKEINKKYKKEKRKSKKIEIELILFSMFLESGLEPVYYIPRNYDIDLVDKVCKKSMHLIPKVLEAIKKETISFESFVELDALGTIYNFQIKDMKAKSGSYDSIITILVDYKFRGILYENESLLKKYLNETREKLIKKYYSKKKYKKIFNSLKKNLGDITFKNIPREDLKADMIEQVKMLAQFS